MTVRIGNATLYNDECLSVMRSMPDSSVDAIVTDPPYFKVKSDAWDRQWDKPAAFLEWLGTVADEWQRILKPNGSLYCFASPQMAARVEVMLGDRFNVLNRITWAKPCPFSEINKGASNSGRVCKESLRSFYPNSEAVIFAEHFGADNIAKGEAGYQAKCDELRGFVFEPLRAYICGEFERAGMLNTEGKIAANVACGFSASSGGMASRHYFSQSQWCLPTAEHYQAMRDLLNKSGGDYLKREYDDLKQEYDDLKQEYEALRRPFSVTADVPYTDVWTFKTVQAYRGKHPCEKPLDMMQHIIRSSTREGAVVLDCFMGSGSTGEAALTLGREFIGIELDKGYFANATQRLSQATAQERMFA